MFKKIRQSYWNHRDKGKGKIFILKHLILIFIIGLCIASPFIKTAFLDSSINTDVSTTSDQAVSGKSTNSETESATPSTESNQSTAYTYGQASPSASPTDDRLGDSSTPDNNHVNTSSMSSLISFMAEDAYNEIEAQIVAVCAVRGLDKVSLLSYQSQGTTDFSTINYLQLSDDTIWQIDYDIKTAKARLYETNFTDEDISMMKQASIKEQQQSEDATSKKSTKKSKKKSSRKKTSHKKNSKK